MRKHKLLAGILAATLVVTSFPATLLPADKAKADTVTSEETTIQKTQVSNPIVPSDIEGTLNYGGDPAVLVDGDTVYLYTGRDSSTNEAYYMLDWQCYSTTDLKTWTNEGVIMSADKDSITWANTGTDAWAGQIEKYNGKYYFYYCTWDSTSSGKQSIGVATSDSPTGPFTDIGHPLVQGTLTTGESSGWNDIDPTVWVETDENGEEHRYLSWGNGKVFVCELNKDMISVKDINGDGKITFGTQASGKTSADVDIIEKNVAGLTFTEAPWIYRRKDESGNPTGLYYLFYAYGWREEMAYATTDDLMDGKLTFGGKLMPPTATSNTNHMAVFDFKGKTYFIYHNGSLPGGSGFRRTPCITELHFNEDGSIQEIPETAIGIYDNEPYKLYNSGVLISHENFVNSSEDGKYPYMDITVGNFTNPKEEDAEWAIVDGKYVPDGGNSDAYVSIQSENKPGLYLTANDTSIVTLNQDAKYSTDSEKKIVADENTAKAQTFHTVKGLDGKDGTISFESVYKPGNYLSLSGGQLVLTDGSNAGTASFTLNDAEEAIPATGSGVDVSIESLTAENYSVTEEDNNYSLTVPFETKSVKVDFRLADDLAYAIVDGVRTLSTDSLYIPLSGKVSTKTITVYAADGKTSKDYMITISKSAPTNSVPVYNTDLFKIFTFDDQTDGATAVTKATVPASVANPLYSYVDGRNGKAIQLTGSYGLKLCDAAGLGNNYSISYWMKPDIVKTNVDPTLAAGLFNPEYWLNLTFGRSIWSKANNTYIDDAGTVSYKANEWQHVTLTVEGSSAKLYVNGELTNEGTIASGIMSQNGAAIYFGVNAWDNYFEGTLDEVAIFNRVLSADEIQSIAYEATNVTTISTSKDPSAESPAQPTATPPTSPASPTPSPEPTTPSNSVNTATVSKVTVKAANQKPGTKTVYLKKGGKVTLSATVTGTGSFSKTVTWKSSKTKVATVSSKGVVKAKAAGTAKITVTSKANTAKKATITVKVSKKAVKNKKLKLKATKKSLKKGKTYTLGIKSMTKKTTDAVTYKSSKKSVASVDKFGVVTAKKKGKATITVKCGKKSAKLAITVK